MGPAIAVRGRRSFTTTESSASKHRLQNLPMKHKLLFTLPACLVLLLLLGPSTAHAQLFSSSVSPKPFDTGHHKFASVFELEHITFGLVNHEREKAGLAPLVWVDEISTVARLHSEDMATNDFFAHASPNGRTADGRAEAHGLKNWRSIGENLAYLTGYGDPAVRAVIAWMKSPGHRRNILTSDYRESGIGVAITPKGGCYITQVFMRRK